MTDYKICRNCHMKIWWYTADYINHTGWWKSEQWIPRAHGHSGERYSSLCGGSDMGLDYRIFEAHEPMDPFMHRAQQAYEEVTHG